MLWRAQADQTYQTASGGKRREAVHQSPADTTRDDDKRPRIRREGKEKLQRHGTVTSMTYTWYDLILFILHCIEDIRSVIECIHTVYTYRCYSHIPLVALDSNIKRIFKWDFLWVFRILTVMESLLQWCSTSILTKQSCKTILIRKDFSCSSYVVGNVLS